MLHHLLGVPRIVGTEIAVKLVSAAEILEDRQELESKWANIKPLPSTQSVHYIKVMGPYIVQYKQYSLSSLGSTFNMLISQCPQSGSTVVEPEAHPVYRKAASLSPTSVSSHLGIFG